MAKAQGKDTTKLGKTPVDFDQYFPEWMTLQAAILHVAKVIGDYGRAVALVRRGLCDGTIGFEPLGSWTKDRFRFLEIGKSKSDGKFVAALNDGRDVDVLDPERVPRLRLRDVYTRWPPPDWPPDSGERQQEDAAAEDGPYTAQANNSADQWPAPLDESGKVQGQAVRSGAVSRRA
jgi:hypothetical protein